MKVLKMNDDQMTELSAVDAQMEVIQSEIDGHMAQIQEATKVVDAIRAKVKPLRAQMAPLAEEKVCIANASDESRRDVAFLTADYAGKKELIRQEIAFRKV